MSIYIIYILLLSAQTLAMDLKIEAEKMLLKEGMILCEDNVKLEFKPFRLSCQKIEISTITKSINSSGDVIIDDGINYLSSKKFSYNYENETGFMEEVDGKFKDWRINCQELKNKATEVYYLEKPKITSCDRPNPCYYFKATNGKVIPDKKWSAKNVIFNLKGLNIFYLPYFSRTLKERKYSLEFYPGYKNGLTLKTIYLYRFRNSYAKFIFDYFPENLSGGIEYNYMFKNMKGSIYTSKVFSKGRNRWSLLVSHQQNIKEKVTIGGDLNFYSDEEFNNIYFTESWYRVNRKVTSNIFIDYISDKTFLKSVITNTNTYLPDEKKYEMEKLLIPSIRFGVVSIPFFGFQSNFLVSFDYEFISGGKFFLFTDTLNYEIYKKIGLSKIQLLPKINISKIGNFKDKWVNVVKFSALPSLTHTPFDKFQYTISYSYIEKLVENTLRRYTPTSLGVEKNFLTLSSSLEPIRASLIRISSGYDFKESKIAPYKIEFTYNLERLNLYSKLDGVISPFELKSSVVDISYKLNREESVSISQYITSDKAYSKISLKKQLDLLLASVSVGFSINGKTIKFEENSIDLDFDLHCWGLNIQYKKRHNLEEAFVNFYLKLDELHKRNLQDISHEKKYYQWR